MKPKLFLLLKVLLCFLLLYSLRDWVAEAYLSVLLPVGSLLLAVDVKDFPYNEVNSLRIVAYLSLVIATPNCRLPQRLFVILIGLAVFGGIDLAGLFLWPTTHPFQSLAGITFFQLLYGFVWNLLGDLLLPFLLWLVAFDRHLGLFFPDAAGIDAMAPRGSLSRG
jgi:hypothetical protein